MSMIAALAAGVLMNPANIATDVSQQPAVSRPEYDWKVQKAVFEPGSEVEGPQKMASVNATQSYVGQTFTIDDWRTWD
jgi:hypothetical protein